MIAGTRGRTWMRKCHIRAPSPEELDAEIHAIPIQYHSPGSISVPGSSVIATRVSSSAVDFKEVETALSQAPEQTDAARAGSGIRIWTSPSSPSSASCYCQGDSNPELTDYWAVSSQIPRRDNSAQSVRTLTESRFSISSNTSLASGCTVSLIYQNKSSPRNGFLPA